ncbi:hypothetical protein [Convivina intestini]|uniref:hypothetical protein n=1 Tax=Convivina intestini TaxID=1505726 RepID=UPI00200BF323|nr:hypothetical protein [Convivina intestini]CAH1853866.1 hypothetical protein R078131_00852 [Convivina intestini]
MNTFDWVINYTLLIVALIVGGAWIGYALTHVDGRTSEKDVWRDVERNERVGG